MSGLTFGVVDEDYPIFLLFLLLFQVDVTKIDNLANNGHLIGELRLKPLSKTTFLGYGPDFVAGQEWISTGYFLEISCSYWQSRRIGVPAKKKFKNKKKDFSRVKKHADYESELRF
ncbi:unnamed protein product [Meloidogyne enterolobii]|uniref:Uncharacterized protein n=1 Tax=Meloidogyne enterolobii TaxID=390850 RepID=A0ACB0YED4_MELEN